MLIFYVPIPESVSVAPLKASEQTMSIRLIHEVAKEEPKPEPKEEPLPKKPEPKKIEPKKLAPKKVVKKEIKKVVPKKVEPQKPKESRAPSKSAVSKAPIQADIVLEAERSKAKLDYTSLIVGLIAKKKRYPSRAQRLRLEDEVGLTITVSREGELLSSGISKESKHSCFNNEVMRMVKAAAPFPEAPKSFYGSKVTIDIPVQFELRR